jgi:hypothetical protein
MIYWERLIVHYDINTRTKYPNSKETLRKVLQTIAPFKAQWSHCTLSDLRFADLVRRLGLPQ